MKTKKKRQYLKVLGVSLALVNQRGDFSHFADGARQIYTALYYMN